MSLNYLSIQTVLVLALTLICAVTDWRQGKVYNICTYPTLLLGLLLSIFFAPPDFQMSLAGVAGALIFFGILWQVGGIGAGDVKLLAAVGALKGFLFVAYASFYIVCTAAIAGVFLLAVQGRLWIVSKWMARTLASAVIPGLSAPPLAGEKTNIPFAPFVFIGTAITVYLEIINGSSLSF